jgi:trans-2,3-dihydro-3-hydroxyanthranilate isomerase
VTNPFSIVDVFAERRYSGNPLAVVRRASDLRDDEMQAIARETNYSETTFVLRDEPGPDGGFATRIFTPREEIPFAGHPTLGTAAVLLDDVLGGGRDEVALDLKVGPIRVRREASGLLWMRQNAATFGATHAPRAFAAMLGLREDEVATSTPIEDVSTGLLHTIVPLASGDAVRRCVVDLPLYRAWCERSASKSIMVYARTGPGALKARVFPIHYGIAEDPATGSAAGCLAGYLARHGGHRVEERVEQGVEMGRPSLLRLRAASEREIDVGGRVQRVADGALRR